MKKFTITFVALTLLLMLTGCGCTNNAQSSSKDISPFEIINSSGGHTTKKGHNYSYYVVLENIYDVSYENYNYSKLKFSKYLDDTGYHSLQSDYKYVLCKLVSLDGNTTRLIFAYDTRKETVIGCFNEEPLGDSYYMCWDAYEETFCHFLCKCGKF